MDSLPGRRVTEPPAYGVAIVGAGFAGIGLAIRLKQAGRDDFVIVERSDRVGGTWRDNTYPGCACDIPSHLYSFSFASKADWSRRYPTQPEIEAYLEACIERFALRRHLSLGVGLKSARFDEAADAWRLETDTGPELAARIMVLAIGALHRPAVPAFPGSEGFRGTAFHSARWNHAIDLRGRHIAVIGTGASAIQFVPRIADRAGRVVLFQRTPAWILPKHDPPYGARRIWALRRLPLLRRALRAWQYISHEMRAPAFIRFPALAAGAERRARSYAKRQVNDERLRALLTPADRIGCKRVLLSNDYFPCLNRANVDLVVTPIDRVTPHGVLTTDGAEYLADVLIFATGFRATEPLGEIEVFGRNGLRLADAWRDGMRARLGLAVTGFPNLFILGGPNTGLGHNSVVFMLEAQIGHVLRCLRLMRRRKALRIEVGAQAQAAFARRLDRRMQRTVWMTGCRSWYLDRNGRNTTLWPGFSFGYWLRTLIGSARHYRLTVARKGKLRRLRRIA
jgi:cation diffusion facilitator CzcD-associated flavoprotein CzcO